MTIVEVCPKCGHDLIETVICTMPPIPRKECPKCGWSWEGKQDKVERVPFSEPTCNDCPQLNVTESEQDRLRTVGVEKFHLCNKYGKRVFHWSSGKNHDTNIYPCSECKNDRNG